MSERCEHCGSDRIYSGPPDCPGCGAPVCCQTCCKMETLRARVKELDKSNGILLTEGLNQHNQLLRLHDENTTLRARVAEYERWFNQHATVLATHGIGGFKFESEKVK